MSEAYEVIKWCKMMKYPEATPRVNEFTSDLLFLEYLEISSLFGKRPDGPDFTSL